MRILVTTVKRLLLVPAFAAVALVAACGGGVELEGPGFEALGLTSNKNKTEPKVPERAPLLIPPDRARLPEPQESTAAVPAQNWPTDPDAVQKAEADEVTAKQKEYQDKGNWDPKAGTDEFEKLMDPMERQPGVFSRGRLLGRKYRDGREYAN